MLELPLIIGFPGLYGEGLGFILISRVCDHTFHKNSRKIIEADNVLESPSFQVVSPVLWPNGAVFQACSNKSTETAINKSNTSKNRQKPYI